MSNIEKEKPRVVFVCTGNTCRSVLAEYLSRKIIGPSVLFESAGIMPGVAEDTENAVYTLKQFYDIDASGHVPRHVNTLEMTTYTLVVVLDKRAKTIVESLGVEKTRVKFWNIQDPYGDDIEEYRATSKKIIENIRKLKASGDDNIEG